jgi:transcriptional regulator with XRE-family HTH domain
MTEGARVYSLEKQRPEPHSVEAPAVEPLPVEAPAVEPLWREVLGRRLRALRGERGETLVETAERAGLSPQYLSEVERGLKEPSSEMIAALAGALGTTLADLTASVTDELRGFQIIGNRMSSLTRAAGLNGAVGLNQAGPSLSGPVALALAS